MVTVLVPLTFTKRDGRKLVVTPDGAAWAPRPRVDNVMVKALSRAFRWRKMLDTDVHATVEDLAKTKRLAPSYVSSILRLTRWSRRSWRRSSTGGSPRSCSWMTCWTGFHWDGRNNALLSAASKAENKLKLRTGNADD